MKKKNVYFVVMCAMAGLWLVSFLMRKQAESARAASDKIMKDFKTIDESLMKKKDSTASMNRPLPDTNKTPQ